MRIRRYRQGDSDEVSRFMNRCFVRNRGDEIRSHGPGYYRWRYGANPWGRPVVWVAEEETGQIRGLTAVVPKPVWIRGQAGIWGECGDTFIDPAARGKNLFLDLTSSVFDECREAGLQFIYGSPNPVSGRVLTGIFGFKTVFTYRSMVRPLNFSGLIASRLRFRPLSKALGFLPDAVHRFLYWPSVKDTVFHLIEAEAPDSQWDSAWAKIRESLNVSLLKDRRYIKWRYTDHPDAYEMRIVMRNREPAGTVVFKLTPVHGMLFGHIVDLTVPCEPEEEPALWNTLLAALRRRGADWASIWQIDGSTRIDFLRRIGFIKRRKPFEIILRGEAGAEPPADLTAWCFSQADTDQV